MQNVEETIEGFYFEDEAVAKQAMKEYMYIEKMKDSVSALRPEDLKEFYHKLIDKHIFCTQVGYTYLYEIRCTLVEVLNIDPDELDEIIIPAAFEEAKSGASGDASEREDEIYSLKRSKKLLSACVGILLIVIAGFFAIIATNEDIGYINTENKILNKYAKWQEELEAREQALEEREAALNEGVFREDSSGGTKQDNTENTENTENTSADDDAEGTEGEAAPDSAAGES